MYEIKEERRSTYTVLAFTESTPHYLLQDYKFTEVIKQSSIWEGYMGFLTASLGGLKTHPPALQHQVQFFPWLTQGLKYHFPQNWRFILEIIVSSLEQLSKCKRAINLLSTHFPNLQGDTLASDFLQLCQPAIKWNQWKKHKPVSLHLSSSMAEESKHVPVFQHCQLGELGGTVEVSSGVTRKGQEELRAEVCAEQPCLLPPCTGSICSLHQLVHVCFYWAPHGQHETVRTERDNPVKRTRGLR